MQPLLVIAVVADALQGRAVAIAQAHGAQGISIIEGRGIGFPEHRVFFGLTYRGYEKVLAFVLDERRARAAEAALNYELLLEQRFKGLVISLPIEEAMGADMDLMSAHLDKLDANKAREQ